MTPAETNGFGGLSLNAEFDSMVTILQERDKALVEANQELERRIAEATLEIKEMQAALVNQARLSALGEMAGGIAHEINNPLAITVFHVSQLKDCLQETDLNSQRPILEKSVNAIERTQARISKIIKGMRWLVRDASSQPFERAKMAGIVQDVLDLTASKAKNHGINIETDQIPEDYIVECRSTEIGQVLVNLISNACDAVKQLSEKWVRVGFQEDGDHCILSVTDSGEGIPINVRDKIMLPFFTTKPIGEGTGLGLSIVKGILDRHSGTISLDESSSNTKFVVRIPRIRKRTDSTESNSGNSQAAA